MKSQSEEKRYMPEMPQKEIEELRSSIKATSMKVMTENIAVSYTHLTLPTNREV